MSCYYKNKSKSKIMGTPDEFTKVSMKLNERSIENVQKMSILLKMKKQAKAKVVSTALEIARTLLEKQSEGYTIILEKGSKKEAMNILVER